MEMKVQVILVLVRHPFAHHLEDKRRNHRVCLGISRNPGGLEVDYRLKFLCVFDPGVF
jgi:hypothetical protein